MINELYCCKLCPRDCKVDRLNGQVGFCMATDKIKIGQMQLHYYEEPCISGEDGSGAVFFSHCNLRCVYCQNFNISQENCGKEISIKELSDGMIDLQNKGANNINLVTATHYLPQVIEALIMAKNNGLNIPIIYNSSGYETQRSIDLLKGHIDVYLPDLKYFSSELSKKYSMAKDYFSVARKAIDRMFNQVGEPVFNEKGMITSGVIIRHLVLPGHTKDSKDIINYIFSTYGNRVFISIMNQYTPLKNVLGISELNRKVTKKEYDSVVDYAISIGVENGFIQEGGTVSESFIPKFFNGKTD